MFANLIPVLYFTCFHYRLCCNTNFDIDSSRIHPSHKWNREKKKKKKKKKPSPAIKWPNFSVFRATSYHWEGGAMYLVDSKLSDFAVKVSANIILSSCNIKIVWLHQIVRRYTFTFHWLFRVQLVTNSDSQISEVKALNPSFTMFSG